MNESLLPSPVPTGPTGVETMDPSEIERNRALTREEIQEELSKIRQDLILIPQAEMEITLTLPAGTNIGGIDYGGKPLSSTVGNFIAMIDEYETPFLETPAEPESQEEKKIPNLPVWLEGHEELIWHGTAENPLWMPEAKQYEDKVVISYKRLGKALKPGRSAEEQGRLLETTENTFTIAEWSIAGAIFKEYQKIEEDFEEKDGDIEKREKAKELLFRVVREENSRRHDGPEPQTIYNRVIEIRDKIARTTRGFKPDKVDIEELTQRISKILSQLFVLNRTRGDGLERVPKVSSDIKEFPSFTHSLSELAMVLEQQQEKNRGTTIITGEAGTGKNEMVKYMAAKTNRPYFWFPCSRRMDPIELITHYEFDAQEGTRKFLTDLAEGLQTPGAIVFIDEYNALDPRVQAFLNGLGDSSRMLSYDSIRIPVAENVLIILAGNPSPYSSAGEAAPTLLDRSRGYSMIAEYPPLTKGKFKQMQEDWTDAVLTQKETEDNTLLDYACNEALILFPRIPELSRLSDKEFELLWDLIVNNSTQSARRAEMEEHPEQYPLMAEFLEGPNSEAIRKTMLDLRDILRVAEIWRQSNQKEGSPFKAFGFSMRSALAVAEAYARKRDVRLAFLSIFADFKANPRDNLDALLIELRTVLNDIDVAWEGLKTT